LDPAREGHWFLPTETRHVEFFDDVSATFKDDHPYKLPSKEMVARTLEFAKTIQKGDKVLIHCHAGISRSTAMAIAVAVQFGLDPERAIKWVEEVRPQLYPNVLIIQYADEILGLDGALFKAYEHWRTNVQGVFYMPPEVTKEDVSEMQRIKDLLNGL
jgi:predicted protein tyrosine phosphatase